MAYNNKLRPRKALLECLFFGKIGKFDFTDTPIKWKDMTDEMLMELVKTASKKSIADHLTGEIPTVKSKEKLSKKPSTNDTEEPKK